MRPLAILVVVLAACNGTDGRPADDRESGRLGAAATVELYVPLRLDPTDGAMLFDRRDVPMGGAYWLGSAEAPVTVVEFADFECPYCARSHERLADVRDRLTATGEVRWVFADFPLPNHERAIPVAAFARCAADLGRPIDFWRVHDALFERQPVWSTAPALDPVLERLGADLGLDPRVTTCAHGGGPHRPYLDRSFRAGVGIGIPGTPTYFIGGLAVGSDPGAEDVRALIADLRAVGAETLLLRSGGRILETSAD